MTRGTISARTNSESGGVLNASPGEGAAEIRPSTHSTNSAAPLLCRRGHDKYKTGIYLSKHKTSTGKAYTVQRCRQCRIDDVRKCLGRMSGAAVGW